MGDWSTPGCNESSDEVLFVKAMEAEFRGIKWEVELQEREGDVNKQWKYIKERILETADKYIPNKMIKKDKSSNTKINNEMRQLIRKNIDYCKNTETVTLALMKNTNTTAE